MQSLSAAVQQLSSDLSALSRNGKESENLACDLEIPGVERLSRYMFIVHAKFRPAKCSGLSVIITSSHSQR